MRAPSSCRADGPTSTHELSVCDVQLERIDGREPRCPVDPRCVLEAHFSHWTLCSRSSVVVARVRRCAPSASSARSAPPTTGGASTTLRVWGTPTSARRRDGGEQSWVARLHDRPPSTTSSGSSTGRCARVRRGTSATTSSASRSTIAAATGPAPPRRRRAARARRRTSRDGAGVQGFRQLERRRETGMRGTSCSSGVRGPARRLRAAAHTAVADVWPPPVTLISPSVKARLAAVGAQAEAVDAAPQNDGDAPTRGRCRREHGERVVRHLDARARALLRPPPDRQEPRREVDAASSSSAYATGPVCACCRARAPRSGRATPSTPARAGAARAVARAR